METIAEKYLLQLRQRAAAAGIQLQLPSGLAERLGRESCRTGGARNLRHLVQEQVEGPLAIHLLQAAKQPEKVEGILKETSLEFIS